VTTRRPPGPAVPVACGDAAVVGLLPGVPAGEDRPAVGTGVGNCGVARTGGTLMARGVAVAGARGTVGATTVFSSSPLLDLPAT
jgi:hypothetical protein